MEIVSIYFVQDGGLANCRRVHDMDTTDGICAGERISPQDAIFFYTGGIFPVMRDRRELEKKFCHAGCGGAMEDVSHRAGQNGWAIKERGED